MGPKAKLPEIVQRSPLKIQKPKKLQITKCQKTDPPQNNFQNFPNSKMKLKNDPLKLKKYFFDTKESNPLFDPQEASRF